MVSEINISEELVREKAVREAYKDLLKDCEALGDNGLSKSDRKMIESAFFLAYDAHKNTTRKSGEPYILHPIEVAQIVTREIGLDTISVVAALLHDVVEDTDYTVEDIEKKFNPTVAKIVDGLTKIKGLFKTKNERNTGKIRKKDIHITGNEISIDDDAFQPNGNAVAERAENFRKLVLTLGEDVRVILIKLADRLHNMRTMSAMPPHKQKIKSDETMYLYAPIAHRLGLYKIKSELEDLAFKYLDPDKFFLIKEKLSETKVAREKYIKNFIAPIEANLDRIPNFPPYKIFGRPKHIFSINNKMHKKRVSFEDIFDLFAIRIILDTGAMEGEVDIKNLCWSVVGSFANDYRIHPNRIRDWISQPKNNGYSSLHVTVMGPEARWVEIQIRTKEMDEIAEKGVAAHWKYKGGVADGKFETWLNGIREHLKNKRGNPVDFMKDFRLELYDQEVFVFSPKGEVFNLKVGATVLDFAFSVHTELGRRCIGAKIDGKLCSISQKLQNGDKVEIITSKKQKPTEEWLNIAVTSKARNKIKSYLKETVRQQAKDGKEILDRKLRSLKVKSSENLINELAAYFKFANSTAFLSAIFAKKFDINKIKELEYKNNRLDTSKLNKPVPIKGGEYRFEGKNIGETELNIFEGFADSVDYSIAKCCNPVAGDRVFGFLTIQRGITIHRKDCPNGQRLHERYPYRIVNIKWNKPEKQEQKLISLRLNGIDDIGLVNQLTKVISSELNINMRSISLSAKDGIFDGNVDVFVKDEGELNRLMKRLQNIDGIYTVNIV